MKIQTSVYELLKSSIFIFGYILFFIFSKYILVVKTKFIKIFNKFYNY
jgi:hypothetical protein